MLVQMWVGKAPYQPRELPRRYGAGFADAEGEDGEVDLLYERIIGEAMKIEDLAEALIERARAPENLAEMPVAWLPWW
jgi:hypothetical protein